MLLNESVFSHTFIECVLHSGSGANKLDYSMPPFLFCNICNTSVNIQHSS